MNRRDVLRSGGQAAAAVALLPLPAALAQQAGWKPAVFSETQNESVIALTEAIIPATDTPGAKEAQVNRYMDLLLKDGPAPRRTQFLEGLNWLEEYSLKKHNVPFGRLSAAQQTAIVKEISAESVPTELEKGHQFFRFAKMMTAQIYYATAVGFRELNKGGRVPASFGCKHTEGHA